MVFAGGIAKAVPLFFYFCARTNENMKRALLTILFALAAQMMRANHWEPDPYQFADNMNVIGVIEINGIEQTSTQLEIGAFCGDECRGSEMLAYYVGLDRYMVFLTLYGQYGHTFDFRLYDHASQRELDLTLPATIQFVANNIIGSLSEPYVFSFTGSTCVIGAEAQPVEGGTVVGAGIYMQGETCTLTANSNHGYVFDSWKENDVTVFADSVYSFTVEGDRELTAVFQLDEFEISLEVDPIEGGSVEGDGTYSYGETVTVHATANPTYSFTGWKENDEVLSTTQDYTFTVGGDRHLVAVFEQECYVVTVTPEPMDGGDISGAGNYVVGSLCQLEAFPKPGYVFERWMENGETVSTTSFYSFVVNENQDLKACFFRVPYEITLSAEPETGGIVEGGGIFYFGDMVTVRALTNPTYYFINWKENGEVVGTNQNFTFAVDGNHHFVATFAQDCYVVTATPEPINGGSITGAGNYIAGTQCQLVAHSAPGYGFDKWTENGVTVSNSSSYSFTVNENHDLTAHFFLVPYEIVAVADPETGGTVDGGGWFYYGDVCTLTAEPAEDYSFTYWSLSGEIVSLEPEISFNVTGDKTYTAHFVYYDEVEDNAEMVSVYPNPARDKVCLHCVGMEKVEAFDVVGRKILEKDCDSDSVEIGFEQSGLYVVRVIAGNKDWTCKILIEK